MHHAKWWAGWSTSWNKDCKQISITSETQMTPSLWQKVKRNWRASWWKWKRKVKNLTWNSTFKKIRSWHQVPSLNGKWMGKHWKQWETLFFWAPISLQMVTATMKLKKTLTPWNKSYDQTRGHIKNQRHYFADKGPSDQSYGFPSNHVWKWNLNHKDSRMLKNWCFWTVMLEKTLERPLDCKEIKLVNPKGN